MTKDFMSNIGLTPEKEIAGMNSDELLPAAAPAHDGLCRDNTERAGPGAPKGSTFHGRTPARKVDDMEW
jgi:hypothetical protein